MAGGSADRHADGASEAAPLIGAAAIVLAAANVVFGLVYRTDAERAADFIVLLDWAREWAGGGNPYAAPYSHADYPPNALVLLAPLTLLSAPQAIAVWSAVHLTFSAVVAALAARLARVGRWSALAAGAALALPSFRIVMQTSVASFALGAAAFVTADRHPRLAGLALGLSIAKPQIGGPFLLWAIAGRRWKTVFTAIGVAAALFAVYLLRAMRPPHWVAYEWLQALAGTQNRDDLAAGETHLQPLLDWTLPPVWIQALTAIVLCAALVFIWIRRRRGFDLRFAAAACLVSLLSFRHLSYDLLLAIPAMAFAASRTGAGRWIAGCAAAVFIASPPSVWRHVIEPRFGSTPFDWLAANAYRIAGLGLLLFVALASEAARTPSVRPRSSA